MHTPRPTLLALLFALAALVPVESSAQAHRVISSPHDFSVAPDHGSPDGSSVSYSDACASCHALPSTTAPSDGTGDVVQYAMYESPTMDMRVADRPGSASMACLSCHDGTLGSAVHTEGDLGWDLTNDHPISVSYDSSADPSFRTADEVAAAGLKLYANGQERTVECGSCHNPHDNQTAKGFLRVSNAGSHLCKICHVK